MKPGLYYNIPASEYRKAPGLNQSTLKQFKRARTPAHYIWEAQQPREQTPEMRIGSAVDCVLFTPDEYSKQFAAWEGRRQGSKWEEFQSEHAGKSILNQPEFERADGCVRALQSDKQFCDAMKVCKFQVAAFADHPELGPVKALFDMLPPKALNFAFDLKTTEDGSQDGFGKQAYNLGYDEQAAWYLMILELLGEPRDAFGFWIVESEQPHLVNRISCKAESIEVKNARARIEETARQYLLCKHENDWPGYSKSWKPLVLPKYAYNKPE